MSKKDAFTLTEILVAIVILGVMAGLAIPNFGRTMRQAESNEARANLNVIFMAQRIFFLNNNACWPLGGGAVTMATSADNVNLTAINTGLSTEMTTARYRLIVTSTAGVGMGANFTADALLDNAGGKIFHVSRQPTVFGGTTYPGGTIYPPDGEGTYD